MITGVAGGEWRNKSQTALSSMITGFCSQHVCTESLDHGGGVPGGWQNKSSDPASQAPRLVIEQTAACDKPLGQAHLSRASGTGTPAPSRPGVRAAHPSTR